MGSHSSAELSCALRRDGIPTSHAAEEDGAALRRVRQRNQHLGRARLVVLAVEVG